MHAQTLLLAALASFTTASPLLGLPLPLPSLPIPGLPLPTPTLPTLPGVPTLPTLPGLPTLPSIPGIPGLPIFPEKSPACVNPLFPSPQCCEINLNVAGLQCGSPAGAPTTPAGVQAACTAAGQEARCCLLNVLGIAVLCQDV